MNAEIVYRLDMTFKAFDPEPSARILPSDVDIIVSQHTDLINEVTELIAKRLVAVKKSQGSRG